MCGYSGASWHVDADRCSSQILRAPKKEGSRAPGNASPENGGGVKMRDFRCVVSGALALGDDFAEFCACDSCFFPRKMFHASHQYRVLHIMHPASHMHAPKDTTHARYTVLQGT